IDRTKSAHYTVNSLERAEFRQRKEQLYANILPHNLIQKHSKRVFLCTYRPALEDEMTILNERIQKYEKELQVLRGENRKNMMLSVALLAISAFFYYTFIY
ncbi:hypothetical protein cypCar_00019663, partial [Cyprinus carpio]